MQQHGGKYFSCRPPPPPLQPDPRWWGQNVKIQLFQNMFMFLYHIKWNRECSNMQAHILSYPCDGVKGQNNLLLLKVVVLHYQIKWNGAYSTMQAHIFSLHTPSTCGLD